jgi:hypothetical protein
VRAANYADALRMELFRMCKNATSAMPVPHKLWLMSKRHEPSYRLRLIEPVVTILSRPARWTAASCVSMRKLWCTPRIL